MGYAIAGRAVRAGHEVTLISGPVCLKPPAGVRMIYINTATEMFTGVKRHIRGKDCLIMAAAVADFRPVSRARQKIKKADMPNAIFLDRNPDILEWAGAHKKGLILAGFCMETQDLLARARQKQVSKNADFMVANKITGTGAPFGPLPTSVVILGPGGDKLFFKNVSKGKIADILLDEIQRMWYKKKTLGAAHRDALA
jgi:phosphopantothenoylcysteine decarboxylase/phosphopantothenate--cysteine ligase